VSRRRLAIGGGSALILAALVAGWLLARGGGSGGPSSGRAVVATTAISPQLPAFADRVTAELRVVVDRRLVDPGSVQVQASFSPYRSIGSPKRSEGASGHSTLLRYRYVLDCLVRECLPQAKPFQFPQAIIRYRGPQAKEVSADWPQFVVVPRIEATDVKSPHMRDGLRPLPRVSYRISPRRLELGLGGAAVLLVLAAAGLVVRTRTRPQFRPTPSAVPETNGALSPLEAALALVRQAAAAGDPVMQRKALERLSTELRRARLPRLARAARRLAWSEPKPRAKATNALADEVLRAVGVTS